MPGGGGDCSGFKDRTGKRPLDPMEEGVCQQSRPVETFFSLKSAHKNE